MAVRQPAPGDLEPIETASRDEIQALQLQRLRWTLQHANQQQRAQPHRVGQRVASVRWG